MPPRAEPGRAGARQGVHSEGWGRAARAAGRGRAPSPPPPPHPGLAPPRAHLASQAACKYEVPERRGPGLGDGSGLGGGPGPCAPGARPHPARQRDRRGAPASARRAGPPGRARAQTPFLARPSSPRLGAAHCGRAARRSAPRGPGPPAERAPPGVEEGEGLGPVLETRFWPRHPPPQQREPLMVTVMVSLWVPALMCFSPFTLVPLVPCPRPGGGADGRWFGAYYNRQPCYVHFTEVRNSRSEGKATC